MVMALIVLAGFIGATVFPASAASCDQTGTSFGSIGTAWGTPASPLSVGPGEMDVPLTVSILFYGPCTVTESTFDLGLTGALTAASGKSSASTYEVNVAPDTILHETFYVNVAADAALGTYTLPMSVTFYTAANSSQLSESFDVSIALKGNAELTFTPSSTVLYAGQVNDLGVTISNMGSGNATDISVSVSTSAQISVLSQIPLVSKLSNGSSVTQDVEVYVPQSSSGSAASLTFSATYYNSYSYSQTSTQTLEFEVSAINPASPYVVESAQWGDSTSSPQPGDTSVPLVLNVEYMGSALATGLKATLGLPSGFSGVGGGASATTLVAAVNPNEALALTFYVDISSAVTPGTYEFGLTLTWSTATSSGLTESVSVSPPAVGAVTNPVSASLSLDQLNSTVVAGVPSAVSFVLSNGGPGSIYSASLSVNVGSPLVVMGNSPSPPLTVVQPGRNVTYTVTFGSSPSSSLGVYSGTVTVAYTDLDGVEHMQTFSVGFTLTGAIEIVVQDEVVSQSSTGLTVSGSLLNEGSASAYYVQVSGTVNGAAAAGESPDYVGEVDPNTPTPFTVVIPYSAPSSAQPHAMVQLDIDFKNSFGTSATTVSSSSDSLESASQLFESTGTASSSGTSSGTGIVTLVSYAIIAVLVISAAAAAVLIGRNRAAKRPKKEDKVI